VRRWIVEERPSGEEQPQVLDLTALEIDQLLGFFLGITSAKAWQYMGLRLKPGAEEAEKDLKRAALSIDCTAFLAEKLAQYLPEGEASRLRARVADLQLNYAKLA